MRQSRTLSVGLLALVLTASPQAFSQSDEETAPSENAFEEARRTAFEEEEGENSEERTSRRERRERLHVAIYAGGGFYGAEVFGAEEHGGNLGDEDLGPGWTVGLGLKSGLSRRMALQGRLMAAFVGGDSEGRWCPSDTTDTRTDCKYFRDSSGIAVLAEIGIRGRPVSETSMWYLGLAVRGGMLLASATELSADFYNYDAEDIGDISETGFTAGAVLETGIEVGSSEEWDIGLRASILTGGAGFNAVELNVGFSF